MENTKEMIEIWKPSEKGEMVRLVDGTLQNLKLVALLVNGIPIKLEKDWILQKRDITEKEAEKLLTPPNITN